MGRHAGAIEMMPSGIVGFDEITGGGLPRGRVSVVIGGAGSGKTVFALQVLAKGVIDHGERGLLVAFEEPVSHLLPDVAAFEWSTALGRAGDIELFDGRLSQSILDGGEFDLIGLLAVLGAKVKKSGARRIVLDGLDILLGHLGSGQAIRREVFRLREWLGESGLSTIITAKAGDGGGPLSADYDFLEFAADCVVALNHGVTGGTALRDLRVSKLRGSAHSANEYPFTISDVGIEVATGSNAELSYPVSSERVSTGIPRLDTMLSGGYYRGSSVLITGAPGSAKTTLAAAFADAACRRGERTVFLSFDEAPQQIVRNVASIGVQFGPHLESGVLRMASLRARGGSPESHVARVRTLLRESDARNLVIDPLSALGTGYPEALGEQAAIQILDIAKPRGITVVSTSLLGNALPLSEESPIGISTVADTWMHLSYVSSGGERNRALTIIKSRGTWHSNQVRELVLSEKGIGLAEVYTAGGQVLMGTLRWEKELEARRAAEGVRRAADVRARSAELAVAEARARMEALAREIAVHEAQLEQIHFERTGDAGTSAADATELRRLRGADAHDSPKGNGS